MSARELKEVVARLRDPTCLCALGRFPGHREKDGTWLFCDCLGEGATTALLLTLTTESQPSTRGRVLG